MRELMPQAAAYGPFNVLLSNGQALCAFCSTSLCVLARRHPFGRATLRDEDLKVDFAAQTTQGDRIVVVATEPLTADENWTPLEPGQLRVFVGGEPVD